MPRPQFHCAGVFFLVKAVKHKSERRRIIIDNLVYKVFNDDNFTPFLTIGNGGDVANVRLAEQKKVLNNLFGSSVQTQLPPARQKE